MARVKNINGTSDNNCKCGSWIRHWEKYSGKSAIYCSAYGCMKNTDLVGAHVQKTTTDMAWYIIPFCPEHNLKKGEEHEVSENTVFVSANRALTCEKNK